MKTHQNILPVSFRENPIFETSGMAALNRQEIVRARLTLGERLNCIAVGMVIGAAIVGAAVLVFTR